MLSEEAFAEQPIVLLGADGHTAWANRVARTRAGITLEFIRALKPDDRQYYGFDSAFNPNGFVVDAGRYKLEGSLPPFSADFLLRAGRAAIAHLNGFGITGWLDAAVSGISRGSILASIDDPGFLPVYKGTCTSRGADGACRGLHRRPARSGHAADRGGRGAARQIQRRSEPHHPGT